MTINLQFGDVDAHGATIRTQAASLKAAHQAVVRDVLAAGDFRNVQTADSDVASTDIAVGSSWI